jgi:putative flippase GtrA
LIRLFTTIETHPRLSRWSAWVAGLPLVGRFWGLCLADPKRVDRFVRFAIVGIIGALVDFGVLNVMKVVFERVGLGHSWDLPMDPHQIQLTVANALSFSAAVLSNFTWNRLWTFPESRERPLGRQLLQFATVSILGLVINTVILVVMDKYVFQHFVSERLSYNLAKAIAIGVVLFWNFGMNVLWTYRGIPIGTQGVEMPASAPSQLDCGER